jgi:hypothetical protein
VTYRTLTEAAEAAARRFLDSVVVIDDRAYPASTAQPAGPPVAGDANATPRRRDRHLVPPASAVAALTTPSTNWMLENSSRSSVGVD